MGTHCIPREPAGRHASVGGLWCLVICDTVYSRLPLAGQQAHESAVRSFVRCADAAVGAVTW